MHKQENIMHVEKHDTMPASTDRHAGTHLNFKSGNPFTSSTSVETLMLCHALRVGFPLLLCKAGVLHSIAPEQEVYWELLLRRVAE